MKFLYIIGGIVVILFLISAKTKLAEDHFNNEGPYPPNDQEGTMDQIHLLIQKGHKIEAIKLYRQMHNVELGEAKEAVEKLAQAHNPR